jgi:hypothetical protein
MKVTRSPTATVISRGLTPLGRIVTVGTTGTTGAGVGAVGMVAPPEGALPPQAKALATSAIVTNEEKNFRVL